MRYMLILLGLIVANVANAIDCETPPDCASLGYSTEPDLNCAQNGYILCPFNEAYKRCVIKDCSKLGFTEDDKTSWCGKLIKCRGNPRMTLCQNLCEIGDVYYSDGTCGYAEDFDPSNKTKIPAGVVFYVNDAGTHGKVIALKNVTPDKDYPFFPPSKNDPRMENGIPMGCSNTLPRYSYEQLISALQSGDPSVYDGMANTRALLSSTDFPRCNGRQKSDPDYPYYCQATAAILTNQFYPYGVSESDSKVGAGNWYIPAMGEILQMSPVDVSKIKSWVDYGSDGATYVTYNIIVKTFSTLSTKGVSATLPTYMPSSNNTNSGSVYYGHANGTRTWDHCEDAQGVRAILSF